MARDNHARPTSAIHHTYSVSFSPQFVSVRSFHSSTCGARGSSEGVATRPLHQWAALHDLITSLMAFFYSLSIYFHVRLRLNSSDHQYTWVIGEVICRMVVPRFITLSKSFLLWIILFHGFSQNIATIQANIKTMDLLGAKLNLSKHVQ